MDFSDALRLIKTGSKLARKAWNNKEMFVVIPKKGELKDCLVIMSKSGKMTTINIGNNDLLANDWTAIP